MSATVDIERALARLGIQGQRLRDHVAALCPFHEDTKPSWRIRLAGERAGLHHCFACGEGGDLVDLVQHVRGYATRTAARDWIAEHCERVTERDLRVGGVAVHVRSHVDRAFRMPGGFSAEAFADWPTPVGRYALARGLTPQQVAVWGIGYALEGRLHGRIVLPVHDVRGQLRSYMARAFLEQPKKYLYPREEEGADKDALFGEFRWPVAMPARGTVVVTEGALKSLAVERALPAVHHAALGGSDLRPMHAVKLSTFAKVVVLTDADAAGEAAGDAVEYALGRHAKVARARLPRGQDADSVPREQLREVLWPLLA